MADLPDDPFSDQRRIQVFNAALSKFHCRYSGPIRDFASSLAGRGLGGCGMPGDLARQSMEMLQTVVEAVMDFDRDAAEYAIAKARVTGARVDNPYRESAERYLIDRVVRQVETMPMRLAEVSKRLRTDERHLGDIARIVACDFKRSIAQQYVKHRAHFELELRAAKAPASTKVETRIASRDMTSTTKVGRDLDPLVDQRAKFARPYREEDPPVPYSKILELYQVELKKSKRRPPLIADNDATADLVGLAYRRRFPASD